MNQNLNKLELNFMKIEDLKIMHIVSSGAPRHV